MNNTNIINLPYISGIEKPPYDLITRDSTINLIQKTLEQFDIVFIEGEIGVGKTTFLIDFVWQNNLNTISHFVEYNYSYTYSYDCILENLYRQIYFYCFNTELGNEINVDSSLFNSIASSFFKKIKQNRAPLYFVFDGFENLKKSQIEILAPIFDSLPWGKASFIFTGSNKFISELFGNRKLNFKEIIISNFGIHETKSFLRELTINDLEIHEIHKLSNKGLPIKLKEIKLLCEAIGGVENFLSSDQITEKTDFLEKLWEQVKPEEIMLIDLIGLVAFSDVFLDIKTISKILDQESIPGEILEQKISSLTFLEISGGSVKFQTDTFRKFAKNKLIHLEDRLNSLLIDYYEKNIGLEDSIFNLPNLYKRAKKWEELTKFYSIDAFIHIIEKYQTLGNINMQFNHGFEAAKLTSSKFNEAYLRFSLHKASVKELEKHDLWESEIEARIVLEDYDQALLLANSAYLKEDRLKLLAGLAKQRKVNDLPEDKSLTEQISDLYYQIDFSKIREKGFVIASLLVYSCFDLAIDLVEKISDNTATKNSLDYAFAYLSIFAADANRKSKTQVADIDVLNAKIQNGEVKNLTNAFRFLSEGFDIEDIIQHIEVLSNPNQKLFLLKNWIFNNADNKNIGTAIKYALEEIVKASIENVPNATSLAEIANPLPKMKDHEEIKMLIQSFDAHKNTIDRPTKDYVKLQLTLAEASSLYDIESTKDRIFDIYVLIEDLIDLSIKTDCLCLLWSYLKKIDTGSEIELSISSTKTLEVQIIENINKLLDGTAYHYKMIEFLVNTLASENLDFVFSIIEKLNTTDRKDIAYQIAIRNYVQKRNLSDIDFFKVEIFYNSITEAVLKEELVLEIIDKFISDKGEKSLTISMFWSFYNRVFSMLNIENKCYAITNSIKYLKTETDIYKEEIEKLLSELNQSWHEIDVQWHKIEIGFLIARNLANYSKQIANQYLNLSTELKHKELFSSDSIAKTYINSTKLCIRAFRGLLISKEDISEELNLLSDTINQIESIGEKLILWSEISLEVCSLNKVDLFKKIFKDFITPLLNEWKIKSSYQLQIVTKIAPSIFLYNQNYFNTDFFPILPEVLKNYAIKNIADFIMYKTIFGESQKTSKLEYSDINELCGLLNSLTNDGMIYSFIEQIVKCIKENRTNLSSEHINSLKYKIKNTIDKNLPTSKGIQHEGYKIVSEAELLTLDSYNEQEWENLISKARSIPNISDKSLVLVVLVSKITVKSNKKKLILIDEAFNLIKSIPSIYDKTNRFDVTWEPLLDIDKGKFNKYMNLAYQDLLSSKDGEISGLKNLIDVAQQHDPKLAESFVTMLDQDVARHKLKEPFLKRIENNNKVKTACTNFNSLSKLNASQFNKVFKKNLEDLNTGRIVSKDIDETYDIIEKASTLTLSESLEAFLYFIQNANKKYESNKKSPENLYSIFLATIENTKLIRLLSLDNIGKMKNLYKIDNHIKSKKNPIISPGQYSESIDYIRNWLKSNIQDRYYFIDPYFTEAELEILLLVKEYNPSCHVTILTSKKGGKNNHCDAENPNRSTNSEVYLRKWHKISPQSPIDTTIKIVWDKDSNECPFHDRWYIAGEAKSCLYFGTSLNGLGNRESQILELDDDALLSVKEMIDIYIFREEKRRANFNLIYERFGLEE